MEGTIDDHAFEGLRGGYRRPWKLAPETSPTPAKPSKSTGGADKFSIIQFLGKVEFFQYLEPEELSTVAAPLKLVTYQAGQGIFRKDEPGSTLHIIASGSVKISMPTEEG